MRIADVLRNKGAAVATITPETSVAGLLTELSVHNIGAMVVVSPDGLVGHRLRARCRAQAARTGRRTAAGGRCRRS